MLLGSIPLVLLDPGNMPVPVSTFSIFFMSMLRSLFLDSPLRWSLAEPGTAVRVMAHRRVLVAALQQDNCYLTWTTKNNTTTATAK